MGAVPQCVKCYQNGVNLPRLERLKCLIPLQNIIAKRGKLTPIRGIVSRAMVRNRLPEEA